MNEDKKGLDQGGAWWQPAVLLFVEVSAWIIAPVVLALILGKALDNHFNTEPLMLLVFAGIGFIITSYGIFKTIRKYLNKIKK